MWRESEIEQLIRLPCPCIGDFGDLYAYRRCGGSLSDGAMWDEDSLNIVECLLDDRTLMLCNSLEVIINVTVAVLMNDTRHNYATDHRPTRACRKPQ